MIFKIELRLSLVFITVALLSLAQVEHLPSGPSMTMSLYLRGIQ